MPLPRRTYYGTGNFQAIEVIESYNLNFSLGSVVKYILRAGKKHDNIIKDLNKAKDYLERELVVQTKLYHQANGIAFEDVLTDFELSDNLAETLFWILDLFTYIDISRDDANRHLMMAIYFIKAEIAVEENRI